MTHHIPKSVSIDIVFGPVDDRSDMWTRLAPGLHTHLDRWWSTVSRWYLQFYGEGRFAEPKMVDAVFAEAKDCWEKDASTLFRSMPSESGHPRLQMGLGLGIGKNRRNATMHVLASWDTQDRERFHEAHRVIRATFWTLLDAIKPVASIYRGIVEFGGAAIPLPDVANLRLNTLLLVEPKAKFLEQFDDPTVLERVAFPEQYELDELLVLGRGTEATYTTEFAATSLDDTFELARAAKKGAVRVGVPPAGWGPEEYALLEDGREQQLYFVGYHPELKIAEYSCAISSPDVHLRPKEIIELCYCSAEKQLPDGRPLNEVRVVFVDRDAAYRERRPLQRRWGILKVCYLGDDGELVEVED